MKNNKTMNKKGLIISSAICLLPIAMSAAVYSQLPEQVATHWGANGLPNGYMPRFWAAFALPVLMLGVNLMLWIVLDSDPKRKNTPPVVINLSKWIVPAMSVAVQGFVLYNAVAQPLDPTVAVTLFVGATFAVIGNYLPKCKQNYKVGIKLPWTLHDEENWNKTHRLAGWLWMVGGILVMASAFFRTQWLMTAIMVTIVLVPMGYSWWLYRNSTKESK